MSEGNGATPRHIVIALTQAGIQIQPPSGMHPEELEMYLAKALLTVQRGLILGGMNALLDQRRAADKAAALLRPHG